MIERLRKRLTLLFLSVTLPIFTAAMCLTINGTVKRIQSYEIAYMENTADSIMELARRTKDISSLNLSEYCDKLNGFFFISDGIRQQSNPKDTGLSADRIRAQISAGKNLLFREEIAPDSAKAGSASRAVCTFYDAGKSFYGLYGSFSRDGVPCEMALAFPRSTFQTVLVKNCGWYLTVWAVVCLLLFFLSRFLIQEAVYPVETAMKSQREFLASASHELKAPLAVIQANAETLNFGEADSKSAQKQKIILSECGRMSDLVCSLLSLAASDTGHWTMRIQETDVDTLLIECWEEYRQQAQEKTIRFTLDIEEKYPPLPCDRERIKQALGILLDNALSYSPPGSAIRAGAKTADRSVLFYVKDHGPGIAEAEKKKVFQRFYSGDPARTDKHHYGLGLSIALEIVTLHRGTISINDTPDGGCTVIIRIPIPKGFD